MGAQQPATDDSRGGLDGINFDSDIPRIKLGGSRGENSRGRSLMSNEEPDLGPPACLEPELGGVFLNSIPGEGWILQKRKGDQGLGVKGSRDFSGEDIDGKARISGPEERESIMKGSEGFKGQARAPGSKLWEDQCKEGRMLPFCRADGPVNRIILQSWGRLLVW